MLRVRVWMVVVRAIDSGVHVVVGSAGGATGSASAKKKGGGRGRKPATTALSTLGPMPCVTPGPCNRARAFQNGPNECKRDIERNTNDKMIIDKLLKLLLQYY
jgi:hypothetical protein